MEQKKLTELLADAVGDADLHPTEIPSIDLYVDQITSLTSEKLKEGTERFHDRVLTKTMINNYSKDGLISPIKGKKYSKDHILQMLLVYSLKNTLSIGEIKRILQNLYAYPDYDSAMLEQIYANFLSVKELERRTASEQVKRLIEDCGLDLSREQDYLTLILGLSQMSSYLKNMAQALLEEHYPDLEEARAREEQERKEKKKEEKTTAKKAKKEEKKEDKKADKTATEQEETT